MTIPPGLREPYLEALRLAVDFIFDRADKPMAVTLSGINPCSSISCSLRSAASVCSLAVSYLVRISRTFAINAS